MNRKALVPTVITVAVLALAATSPLASRWREGNEAIEPMTARVRMNGENIFVTVPRTSSESAKGLGGVTTLGADQGMLWRYDTPKMVTFWMKGMKFALDFIWIRDGQVIGVTPNIPPLASTRDKLVLYRPPALVDRVLEVNAGFSVAHQISVGTAVTEFDF